MASKKPTLKWNIDDGEGDVGNLENFRQLDPLTRCDILGDWLGIFQAEYERTQREFIVWCEDMKNAHPY